MFIHAIDCCHSTVLVHGTESTLKNVPENFGRFERFDFSLVEVKVVTIGKLQIVIDIFRRDLILGRVVKDCILMQSEKHSKF